MKKNIIHALLVSVVAFSASVLVGCAPRGESHTVEQILADARSAYQSASGGATPDVSGNLKSLTTSLDRIAGLGGGGDARQIASDIANGLTDLSVRAGYTVRPAMAELVSQYRTVSEKSDAPVSIGAANLQLLAARTYSLLASELNTTQFRVS